MKELAAKTVSYYYESDNACIILGDSFKILRKLKAESIDMIFADPPYFLSNDGITCQGGGWYLSIKLHGIKLNLANKLLLQKNMHLTENGLECVREYLNGMEVCGFLVLYIIFIRLGWH